MVKIYQLLRRQPKYSKKPGLRQAVTLAAIFDFFMFGIIICIILIFIALVTAGVINCYAILKLVIGSKRLDKATGLGISVVVSLIVTISAMIFGVIPWKQVNLYLLGAISGIGYSSLELTKVVKGKEVFLFEDKSITKGQKVSKVLQIFLKNVGIALLIVLCLGLTMSRLMPRSFF